MVRTIAIIIIIVVSACSKPVDTQQIHVETLNYAGTIKRWTVGYTDTISFPAMRRIIKNGSQYKIYWYDNMSTETISNNPNQLVYTIKYSSNSDVGIDETYTVTARFNGNKLIETGQGEFITKISGQVISVTIVGFLAELEIAK